MFLFYAFLFLVYHQILCKLFLIKNAFIKLKIVNINSSLRQQVGLMCN